MNDFLKLALFVLLIVVPIGYYYDNYADEAMERKLYLAIGDRDIKIVNELIVNGVDINAQYYDVPMLYRAVRNNCFSCVKAFIKAGADLDVQSSYGRTSLMEATANLDLNMVRTLILGGANIDVRNSGGNNALYLLTETKLSEHRNKPDYKEIKRLLNGH
jgi:ankyrin repeat protein